MTHDRPRILVIDDDLMSTAIMEELLGTEYSVLTANGGQAGIEAAQRERPDLVLLDIVMPGMDGYETCRRIRASKELRYTKVLLVSGRGEVGDRVKGYEAGADDHVGKPVDAAELLAKIRVFLRLKSAEEMEQMKSGLLDLLSHEIRTPLSAILPAIEMLNGNYALSDDEQRMMLRTIGDGARRLLRLTERACVLQRARNGGLQLRRRSVDLVELLHAAVQSSPPVRVIAGRPTFVHGDATLVTLAIEELINHACQQTDSPPVIEMLPPGPDGMARLRFSHTGSPTTTTVSQIVLSPLSEDVRDGQTVGAHLGLPTADAIVHAHGGSLWNVPGTDGLCGVEMRLPGHS